MPTQVWPWVNLPLLWASVSPSVCSGGWNTCSMIIKKSVTLRFSKWSLGAPETLSGASYGKNYFHNNIKTLFCLFHFHTLMSVLWNFPEANVWQYRYNWIQKQTCHSSCLLLRKTLQRSAQTKHNAILLNYCFLLKSIVDFHKTCYSCWHGIGLLFFKVNW